MYYPTILLPQLLLTLPLSLFVLLVHNWLLGKFFCYVLPMLQVFSFPLWILIYYISFRTSQATPSCSVSLSSVLTDTRYSGIQVIRGSPCMWCCPWCGRCPCPWCCHILLTSLTSTWMWVYKVGMSVGVAVSCRTGISRPLFSPFISYTCIVLMINCLDHKGYS